MAENIRTFLSHEYFPFGSQYYRGPSPPAEDWDRDLGHMAELGFNTVKYWLQWRWNHPEEEQFYFDDIDRLMDLARKHDLKVMLNTIVDAAPAWIYRKYPDASMLTLDGRRIGPQTQPHRQIGGLGLCFNHEEAVSHMFRFLGACIERYDDHPALEMWNVGSEPELTSSMSHMRGWAYDAEKMGDMLCHCERCKAGFRRWLALKYGEIGDLNIAWNRNYRSFNDAEIPTTRNTFNDIIDWRVFFVDTLGRNVQRRFEVAGEKASGKHAVMCHHVFLQGFPTTSTANDPWNVGRFGDLHGITQMDDPMMSDIVRSCARDKPVISAEMLMLMGYTLDLPAPVDANDIKRNIFTGIAANLKGFIFWQFRPEMLGREAPTWGLTHLDGSATPHLEAFAEVGRVLQDNAGFLLDAEPEPARVAILYHPQNQVFAWASTGTEASATESLLGAHRGFYEHNYNVDFVHPREIDADLLSKYRVIYLPFAYVLGQGVSDTLKKWVSGGGVLIGEAYTGGWDIEQGRHHTTIPGHGLDEVFRVRQRSAAPAQHFELDQSDNAPPVREGIQEMFRERQRSKAPLREPIDITIKESLPPLRPGMKIRGSMVKETFFVEGAKVIGVYDDGAPAVTCAEYGEGKAILIGTYIALTGHRMDGDANAEFIAGLAEFAADISRPRVTGDVKIRVDLLSKGDDEAMLILQNLRPSPADFTVRLPGTTPGKMREVFTGESLDRKELDDGSGMIALSLQANEVKVYR